MPITIPAHPDHLGVGGGIGDRHGPEYAHRGLKLADIDLVELDEAFASQCVYCRDALGTDNEIYNVNGGSIAVGHPFGMTGSRMTGLVVRELRRRNKKLGLVSMCIGKGMGAAGLFEAC